MPAAPTPTPQEVVRALKRLTADRFSQVCSDIGILEVTLPGYTQVAKAAALVAQTQGRTDFAALVRAINRIDPKVWSAIPTRPSLRPVIYGLGAFGAIVVIGGLVLVLILSGSQASQPTPTPTRTRAPTRTSVPTFTHTPPPTATPTPTSTSVPTPRPTSTPAPVVATKSAGPRATASVTASPPVAIVYAKVDLQKPVSGYRANPGEEVVFRWFLRGASIAQDERYWMRIRTPDGAVVDNYLTSDPWRYYSVPSGAVGAFTWTATVVKVDAANNIIGAASPESDRWTFAAQP